MKWGFGLLVVCILFCHSNVMARSYLIASNDPSYIETAFFNSLPSGGDTIFIAANRTKGIIFVGLKGLPGSPIIVTNANGLVNINDQDSWSGLAFRNCQHVKLSGAGHPDWHYGFKLSAKYSGVVVEQNSSNFEIEFVEVDHEGFAGIQVKDDYKGSPPFPLPEFRELVIHDCFIQHVSEGMYLGETKSPGLEFRYVRVFNNMVMNTRREGIQLANMVEDVQVYNNFLFNNGLDGISGQGNNMQIGDNTVADVFNNVLIGAQEYGIVVFGLGHINIYSNYIAQSNGLFFDNRMFTDEYSFIRIRDNYFSALRTDEVILNYNELNPMFIDGNWYDSMKRFYSSNCKNCTQVGLFENTETTVNTFIYSGVDAGAFVNSSANPMAYQSMGPIPVYAYAFNSWPEFDDLEDIFVNVGTMGEHVITASTHDDDSLELLFENVPSFIQVTTVSNGVVKLNIDARNQGIGKYPMFVIAKDQSHEVEIRKPFGVVLKSRENHSPEIEMESVHQFYNLEKNLILLTVSDQDNDAVSMELIGAPDFISLKQSGLNESVLLLQPGFSDSGTFRLKVKADDGFSGITTKELHVTILPKELEPGVVLYRYNLGGPELEGQPMNWKAGNEALYTITEEKLHFTGSFGWKGVNPTSAPDSLFGPYAYIKPNEQKVLFRFACAPANYLIRLYYSERKEDFDSLGATVFNVFAENQLVIPELTIGSSAIGKGSFSKARIEVLDSMLELSLEPVQNYIKLNGIEVSVALPYDSGDEDEALLCFPNPFQNKLYLVNDEADPISEWALFNSIGQIKFKGKAYSFYHPFYTMNTDFMDKGMYYLLVEKHSGTRVQKLIRH